MTAPIGNGSRRRLVPALSLLPLAAALVLALLGALGDSITVDEPSHLVAGYAALARGDFRLSPDHPPLARLLLALPLRLQPVAWRAEGTEAWHRGDFFALGRDFFESWNDGERLARSSRAVALAMLLALLLSIAAIARRLFGPWGGLLALSVAALDPALLAHGHLATMDVPFALVALLTLLAADRWLDRPTGTRLALLAGSFAAATLVKFSWFALVPALLALAWAATRKEGARPMVRTPAQTMALASVTLALAAWAAIWAAYGFRFAAARGADAETATMHTIGDYGRPLPVGPAAAWESILHDPATGEDRRGALVPLLRVAHEHRLLPEAYLYGVAYVQKKAVGRAAYLRGSYSASGFSSYFLWAYLVKTPLPILLLVAAALGLAGRAALRRRGPPPLALGLLVFSLVYLGALVQSGLNLGYRHLLPVTSVLAIAVGSLAAAGSADPDAQGRRAPRALAVGVGAALFWLALGTWRASPHLLGYFNEAVGGWRNGHRYLADSNLDWGQDLLRLRERLRAEPPGGTVWLAQAGDPPLPAGLPVRRLLGDGSQEPSAGPISGGLYAISATDLLGVYRPLARAASWRDPRLTEQYEALAAEARFRGPSAGAAVDAFEALRRLRLISRLAQREPDERVGTSLFLYRLSDDQVAEATEP